MSATPQDFSIWSRMTGNPYPRTPEERMYLAPHVRTFVESIGRQGGYIPQQQSGLGQAFKAIGKTALAAGILTGGAMAAHHYLSNRPPSAPPGGHDDVSDSIIDSLDTIHTNATNVLKGKGPSHPFPEEHESSIRRTGTVMTKLPLLQPAAEAAESNIQLGTPFETPKQYAEGQDELIGAVPPGHVEAFRRSPQYAKMKESYSSLRDIESPAHPASLPQAVRESMDVTPPTPGEKFGEKIIPTEIRVRQAAKGAAPGTVVRSLTETKPVTETARLATSQVPGPHAQDYSLDEHVALATVAHDRGDKATHMKHMAEFARRTQAGEPWRHTDMTNHAISVARQLTSSQPKQEYVGTGHMIKPGAQPRTPESLRLAKETTGTITHLQKYGYDPEQGFGTEHGPMAEQIGTHPRGLLAEQLQRETERHAGLPDIYKKLQTQHSSYTPHPQEMINIHGKGFFHPQAYGI